MSSATTLLAALAVFLIIATTEAVKETLLPAGTGSCPLPSKVYSCSPKCVQSYECSHGKVCCPNSCNSKSCSEPAPYGQQGGDKYSCMPAAYAMVAVLLLIISSSEAGPGGSRCPPRSKVYSCKPVCRQDYDCKAGKVCCPNQCNTLSCAEPAPYGAGSDKYSQSGGPGVYCGNVKCNAYERCEKDPRTGKLVCRRA